MSPTAVLDRVTGGRGALAIRYSMVSVIGVALGQAQLVLYVGILEFDPTKSNIATVMLTAVPAFILNKRWVWNVDGKISFRREIVPFWVFTGAGLALSTLFVEIAHNISPDSTLIVLVANLAGFGVLWVAKFLFLDQIMFGHSQREEVLSQEDHPTV